MSNNNCAFQYATTTTGFFSKTTIVEDKFGLTLEEAKDLYNKHFPHLRRKIKEGDNVEMVIWINMSDEYDYKEKYVHISGDLEVEGNYVFEKTRILFYPELKPEPKEYVFQFYSSVGGVIADTDRITLDEAKKLWNDNYPIAAEIIKNGGSIQMAVWAGMDEGMAFDRNNVLGFIDYDYTSDGINIYPSVQNPVKSNI